MNISCLYLCLLLPLSLMAHINPRSTDTLGTVYRREVAVAFYNLENLFHPQDDPLTFDDDRTPEGSDQWTYGKYEAKLANMAKAIAEIGPVTPSIVGLCELENRQVLQDLLKQDALNTVDYGIIHYDSPDLRGVDVGLIYRKSHFKPLRSVSIEVPLYDQKNDRPLWTRDQLLVEGDLFGKRIFILVNHWPSRSGGKQRSEPKRLSAAKVTKRVTDSLLRLDPQNQIMIMGDFNDNPDDPSIEKIVGSDITRASGRKSKRQKIGAEIQSDFFNAMEKLYALGLGSLAFRDQWFLFDQIIMTKNFMILDSNLKFQKASIHKAHYLETKSGRFKGYPFRSMKGSHFTGGYSDHFPVYITLSLTP